MSDNLIRNIVEVRSKLSTENSNKLLLALGDFVNNLKSKIEGNNLGYIYCLRAASIPFDDIPDDTVGLEELAWVTSDLLIKRLNYDRYKTIYHLSDNADHNEHIDSCFVVYYQMLSSQFSQLVSFADLNIKTINEYFDVLLRKKALATKTNRWGDVDSSAWDSILHEFAYDKLMGASFMSFTDDMPDYIKSHAKSCDIDNLYGRFVAAVLDEETKQRGDCSPLITTGEDFENHIKRLIEANIPFATVETTPRTGDDGADLLVYGNGYSIAIQAKYYSSPVGNSAVQEIYSAKAIYQTNFAVVVTNISYTKAAQEAAETLKVILATEGNIIEIINYLLE